jgi:hypothetical protein
VGDQLGLVVGLVTAITGAEVAVLFIVAGLLMIVLDARPRRLARLSGHGGSALLLPVLSRPARLLAVTAAGTGTLVALGLFFLKAGAFIFGSGLAIVPFLREGVVVQHHWLTSRKFLDAVAIGLITPGRACGACRRAVVQEHGACYRRARRRRRAPPALASAQSLRNSRMVRAVSSGSRWPRVASRS